MADESTPTDPTQVASRDDSALTSAPTEALQSVAQVAPLITPPAPPATSDVAATVSIGDPVAAAALPPSPAVQAAQNKLAAAGIAPIVKSTETTQLGRKKENTDKQIATDRAATDTLAGSMATNAQSEDQRAVAAVDKRIAARQAQQDEANARAAQAVVDKKAADERTKQLMDLPDGKIDPDRFVNSLSTGSKIGLTVLAAISGFANGMRNAGGPNSQGGPPDLSVLNVLTKRIDEDIASQKDQLAQGRLRKSNLIARAEAQGADAKQAESIARAQLWNLSADIGDLQAQRVGLDGANLAAAQKQTAAMRYQSSIHEGEIRAQEEAKISRSRETETGKPVAGKGNPELMGKAWDAYDKSIAAGQDPTTAYRQSGLAELGVTQPTGTPKRTEGEAKASAIVTAAPNYAAKVGLVEDPAHPGRFMAPPGHEDDSPGDTVLRRAANFVGGGLVGGVDARTARQKHVRELTSAREQMAAALVSANSGMKLSEAQDLIDGETLGEIADKLNSQVPQSSTARNAAERNTAAPGVEAFGGLPGAAK